MMADEPHCWLEAPPRMSIFYPELERLTLARMFFGTGQSLSPSLVLLISQRIESLRGVPAHLVSFNLAKLGAMRRYEIALRNEWT